MKNHSMLSRSGAAALLCSLLLGSVPASTLATDSASPEKDVVPDTVSQKGLNVGGTDLNHYLDANTLVFPDGHLELELHIGCGGNTSPPIRQRLDVPTELVQKYFMRLVRVSPAEQRKLLEQDVSGSSISRDILFSRRASYGVTGPYVIKEPGEQDRQLVTAIDYCEYKGPNQKLRKLIKDEKLGIWGIGWIHACKNDKDSDCGLYGQKFIDKVVYAIGIRRGIDHSKECKGLEEDKFALGFAGPIPKEEWKYLRCPALGSHVEASGDQPTGSLDE